MIMISLTGFLVHGHSDYMRIFLQVYANSLGIHATYLVF